MVYINLDQMPFLLQQALSSSFFFMTQQSKICLWHSNPHTTGSWCFNTRLHCSVKFGSLVNNKYIAWGREQRKEHLAVNISVGVNSEER